MYLTEKNFFSAKVPDFLPLYSNDIQTSSTNNIALDEKSKALKLDTANLTIYKQEAAFNLYVDILLKSDQCYKVGSIRVTSSMTNYFVAKLFMIDIFLRL